MKKIVLFFIMFLSVTLCNAWNVQNYSSPMLIVDGFYILNDSKNTKVLVDSDAMDYVEYFELITRIPNKRVEVLNEEKLIVLKPYFKKIVERNITYIVYDNANNRISLIKEPPLRWEESSYLVLIGIALILGMVIFSIFARNRYNSFNNTSFKFEFLVLVIFAISACLTFVSIIFLPFGVEPNYLCYFITVCSLSLHLSLINFSDERKMFFIYSSVYYLSVIIYFGYLFL